MLETTSKERPILFSAPMVRAILAGQKTQTRRVVKHKPPFTNSSDWPFVGHCADGWPGFCSRDPFELHLPNGYWDKGIPCPYGKPGDRLWVRETWCPVYHGSYEPWPRKEKTPESFHSAFIQYNADYQFGGSDYDGFWRPSIHMPRFACRITLEITEVRIERLQSISEECAKAEGIYGVPHSESISDNPVFSFSAGATYYWDGEGGRRGGFDTAKQCFECLWSTIYAADGPNGWAANPWVWVVEFKRMQP